jgi:plastocyanin
MSPNLSKSAATGPVLGLRHARAKEVRGLFAKGWLAVSILTIAAVGLAACSSLSAGTASTSHGSATSGTTITIKNFEFSPSTLSVHPGATVTVENKDGVTHTLSAVSGVFNTGNVLGNTTTRFTAPTKPGTYLYRCDIHQFMTGTLVVS